jgi:2-polyprenyl-3-methyl-5-hydroxy-6-metoxy-1,4-benzoquinol methylase
MKVMGKLEEKLAESLTAETTDLIPHLPYLLQDLWELGSNPEEIIELIRRNIQVETKLRILDLACGKGAVSVKMAKEFGCCVKGIDIMPEFIKYAKQKAIEHRVEQLCYFDTEDISISVTKERDYDVVIFGGAGDILGSPEITIEKLKHTIRPDGFVIIDDVYSRERSTSNYLTYEEWLKIFIKARVKLIEAKPVNEEYLININNKNNQYIINRANELKMKYPEKTTIFDNYINSQLAECNELENEIVAVTWMLRNRSV